MPLEHLRKAFHFDVGKVIFQVRTLVGRTNQVVFVRNELVLNPPKDLEERNPEFATATTVVTDENDDDVKLNSENPVVLDFFGDDCPVCRQLETLLLPVAKKDAETAVFARVSVQQAPELTQQYEVRAPSHAGDDPPGRAAVSMCGIDSTTTPSSGSRKSNASNALKERRVANPGPLNQWGCSGLVVAQAFLPPLHQFRRLLI
ncbi:thioredoxin family protein [Novipirellula caenicola]|uniref:thioredoxin family protein n=1 Tax=Novipirellula caenicola TaxID=1536901 RepID=UPI003CD08611